MRLPLSHPETVAKKEKREREGKINMARYLEQQQSTLDKTAKLRALRLAQGSQETKLAKRTPVSKKTERRALPGLHQGVRE